MGFRVWDFGFSRPVFRVRARGGGGGRLVAAKRVGSFHKLHRGVVDEGTKQGFSGVRTRGYVGIVLRNSHSGVTVGVLRLLETFM